MSLGVTGICRVFRSRPWICLNLPLQTTVRSGVGGGYVLSIAQGTSYVRFPTKEWSAEWKRGCWRSLEGIVCMRSLQGIPSRCFRCTLNREGLVVELKCRACEQTPDAVPKSGGWVDRTV